MAKGKGKKGGKKGKKKGKADPNALTEVDKTFYELTITDLNRKLARLRTLTTELEEKNEELKTSLGTLDEDRNDIIIYLKRMLQEKTDEIAELHERITALEETRHDETKQFEAQIAELELEYKQMHEQLTSEIKLLEGKLNSLEEFRIQRDELMRKFEVQEDMMEEQETRHKNELYQMERKNIIEKDKLKKNMEERLVQLSSEFQDATELRIAATTHRVIRENIAINTELDEMLTTHHKLCDQNSTMKVRDRTLRQELELHDQEKKKALGKARVQAKIIEELTREHEAMMLRLTHYKTIEKEKIEVVKNAAVQEKNIAHLAYKVRLLEQNLHAVQCHQVSTKTDLNLVEESRDQLMLVLDEATYAIRESLEPHGSDTSFERSKREGLLPHLLRLLSEAEKFRPRRASTATVGSVSAAYALGDLGFVPKPVERAVIPTVREMEAQTGKSLEVLIEQHEATHYTPQQTMVVDGEIVSVGSVEPKEKDQEQVERGASEVFFDDTSDQLMESVSEEISDEERLSQEEGAMAEEGATTDEGGATPGDAEATGGEETE